MAAKKSVSLHTRRTVEPKPAHQTVDGRVSDLHGPYLIVAGRRGESCAAVAYLGKKRILEISDNTVESAVAAAKLALDARTAALRAERIGETPTETEFREVLGALYPELSKRLTAILVGHCRLPDAAATIGELARRFDVPENSIKLGYQRFARSLARLLDFAPVLDGLDPKLAPLLSMAILGPTAKGKDAVLRLRPELVAALRGMHQPAG